MGIIKHWKPIVLALAATLLWICWRFLPIVEWTKAFARVVEEAGAAGVAIFIIAYAIGSVFFIPATFFTVAAGIAFGFVGGALVSGAGATLGAAMTFILARSIFRGRIQRWLQQSDRGRALEMALATGGWQIVILFRLTPTVPFALSNYLFGVTRIRFVPFLAATAIGIVPGSLLHTYLGAMGRDLFVDQSGRTTAEYAFLAFGLVATAALATYVRHLSKKHLDQLRRSEM